MSAFIAGGLAGMAMMFISERARPWLALGINYAIWLFTAWAVGVFP